jgi:hypothetical protein
MRRERTSSKQWFGHDKAMRVFVRDCIKDAFAKGQTKDQYLAQLKPEMRATAGEMFDYYKGQEAQADAVFEIKTMPEPMRTLFLLGGKQCGDFHEGVLAFEEQYSAAQFVYASNFARWLKQWSLGVGHGTIDIRWTEFSSKLRPMSTEMVYDMAVAKEIGG